MNTSLLLAGSLLMSGTLVGLATTFTLVDYGLRLDGSTTFSTRDESLPSGVDISEFDPGTGLGSLTINVRSVGVHAVGLFVDHDIAAPTNTFFNEFAARVGTPVPGQTWEIDEPGYQSGNLFTNFVSGRLDNSNTVPSTARNDVAMALGWNFTLSPNQRGLVRMIVGETVPSTGFYLVQSDPDSQRSIYFSSTLEISSGDTEPPLISCASNIVTAVDPGACYRSVVNYSVTATDNSPGVTINCFPPSGSRFEAGTTTVNCVARDTSGNSNRCSFTVTVLPEPPTIHCPGNLIVECALPSGKVVEFSVGASSPCDSNVVVRCQPPSGSVFPIGPTQVNCTATDSAGNRSECSFLVFLVSSSTNCVGSFSLLKETCLAGEVRAEPLLQPYPCGTCVEVTGVPADGWTFLGWLGDARGGARTTQLTMSQNKCVEAVFGTRISVANSLGGTAWIDPAAPLYPCGTQARALARPDPGYFFSHWTNSVAGTANPYDFTVSQTNVVMTPVFLPLQAGEFSLQVEVQGDGVVRGRSGGLIGRYPKGSNVVLRATAEAGQDFLGWSIGSDTPDAAIFSLTNQISVSMTTNRHIVARFSARPRIEIVECQGELVKGLFRFQVHGKVMQRLIIEMTSSLQDPRVWREVSRATNILGAVQYEDPYLPNVPQRFYRARVAGDECTAPPSLTIQQENGQMSLEWVDLGCDCLLQHAASLSAGDWTSLVDIPPATDGRRRLPLIPSGGGRFFRLLCSP
jgi:hypothetical protein